MKQLCPSCGDEFDDGGYDFVECEGCREVEVDFVDESTVYGNDCVNGRCEI